MHCVLVNLSDRSLGLCNRTFTLQMNAGRLNGTLVTFSAILQNKSHGERSYALAIANALFKIQYVAALESRDANWAGLLHFRTTFRNLLGYFQSTA